MADIIDIDVWRKIVDNPIPEVDALFKRKELHVADWHEDRIMWHLQSIVVHVLRALHEGFHDYEYEQANPSSSEYHRWGTLAVRTFALGVLRGIRENADAITPLLQERTNRETQLRQQIAESIRNEMVCPCDSAAKADALYNRDNMVAYRAFTRSPDYHAICHYGEWSAKIAEGEY